MRRRRGIGISMPATRDGRRSFSIRSGAEGNAGAARDSRFGPWMSAILFRGDLNMQKSTHMAVKAADRNIVRSIPPMEDSEEQEILNAIVETPQGSRNKYKYDEKLGLFTLSK